MQDAMKYQRLLMGAFIGVMILSLLSMLAENASATDGGIQLRPFQAARLQFQANQAQRVRVQRVRVAQPVVIAQPVVVGHHQAFQVQRVQRVQRVQQVVVPHYLQQQRIYVQPSAFQFQNSYSPSVQRVIILR